jgi:hypothetical protein
MLPQSHVAYTWLLLSLGQDALEIAPDADYRLVALAAMGSDLIDKPLAWAYFYEQQKAAVLFAHTLLAYTVVAWLTLWRFPRQRLLGLAFLGHAVLDRIWMFWDTFYWPFRGVRFHEWKKQGSEQETIGNAYWHAFTRRPELWIWEVGGLLALAYFIWRYRLWKPANLAKFLLTGRPNKYPA